MAAAFAVVNATSCSTAHVRQDMTRLRNLTAAVAIANKE